MAHQLADLLRRHLIWLLVVCYAVAAVAPGLGQWFFRFDVAGSVGLASGVARFPMVLVAIMLFLAAICTDITELRVIGRQPLLTLASLVGVWLVPAITVGVITLVASSLFDQIDATPILLGLALVAAMPVANSSVGWTQQSSGNFAWALGLVVLSITFSPWVTPWVLGVAGLSLSAEEAHGVVETVKEISGVPFILWVLGPTLTGFAIRHYAGAERAAKWRSPAKLVTAVLLLVLNYIGGSAALPKFFSDPDPRMGLLAVATAGALAMSVLGVLVAGGLARLMQQDRETSLALRYALSMKHTGLALALSAATGVPQEALLPVVVMTFTQHLVASVVDRFAHRGEKASDG